MYQKHRNPTTGQNLPKQTMELCNYFRILARELSVDNTCNSDCGGIDITFRVVDDNARSHRLPSEAAASNRISPVDRWQPTPLPSALPNHDRPESPLQSNIGTTTCTSRSRRSTGSRWESCPTKPTTDDSSSHVPQIPRRTHSMDGLGLESDLTDDSSTSHSCLSLARIACARSPSKSTRRRSSPPICPKRSALDIIDMALQTTHTSCYDQQEVAPLA